jgi:membrane protease subunit (stomatin/prohibitin family)
MSAFLQYELAQSLGDLGSADAGASAAGEGFGFALGMMMPWMIGAHMQRTWPWAYGHAPALAPPLAAPPSAPPAAAFHPRFCGHCGGGLIPDARFCGHCGEAVAR